MWKRLMVGLLCDSANLHWLHVGLGLRHFASHAGFPAAVDALVECGAYVHSVDKA